MRRSVVFTLGVGVLASALSVPPSVAGGPGRGEDRRPASRPRISKVDPNQVRGDYVPGELLVKFRAGVSRAQEQAVHGAMAARVLQRIGGGLDVQQVRLPRGLAVGEAVRRYEANSAVEYAEPNFYRYPAFVPNDPDYGNLWALNNTGQAHPISDPPPATATGTSGADMDVQEAWDTEKGDAGVVIAVIDSGVDTAHVDIAGNLWENPGEIPGNLTDDDLNGKVDDVNGWDFGEDDASLLGPSTALGYDHGTHVSGTIAAVTNNATGVSGVCGGDAGALPDPEPGCSIMVLKFMDDLLDVDGDGFPDMVGTLAAELAAITYAKQEGAHIINGSYGGPSWTNSEREAFRTAGANYGILSVLAAANDNLDNDMALAADFDFDGFPDAFSPAYPASYNVPQILSVAASNHQDEYGYFTGCNLAGFDKWLCAFTNFGRYSVDVAAPGVDVLSTLPGDTYGTFNGTSMAAPHAAGVAGLLKSQDPSRTALTVKNIIMATADTTADDGVTPLDLNQSMNTFITGSKVPGKFTRTAARVNADAGVDFVGTPPNGSARHDGDIPGAKAIKAKATGSLAWPADVNDFKKKKLIRGEKYRITLVVPTGRDYDLFLWKSDTKEIWQPGKVIKASVGGLGADETFTFKPGATRTFYILASSWFSNGSYTLKVRCLTC